jgi:hypothetical protein
MGKTPVLDSAEAQHLLASGAQHHVSFPRPSYIRAGLLSACQPPVTSANGSPPFREVAH